MTWNGRSAGRLALATAVALAVGVTAPPQATAQIQQAFAAMGPQGPALFGQLMQAIRASLATAITDLFLFGAVAMAVGFAVTLFLQEIPLRRTHHTRPTIEMVEDELTDVGLALAPNEGADLPGERRAPERVA